MREDRAEEEGGKLVLVYLTLKSRENAVTKNVAFILLVWHKKRFCKGITPFTPFCLFLLIHSI